MTGCGPGWMSILAFPQTAARGLSKAWSDNGLGNELELYIFSQNLCSHTMHYMLLLAGFSKCSMTMCTILTTDLLINCLGEESSSINFASILYS